VTFIGGGGVRGWTWICTSFAFDFFVGDALDGDLAGVLMAVCFLAGLFFGVDAALTGVFLTGLMLALAFEGAFVGVFGAVLEGDFLGVLGEGVFAGDVICARPNINTINTRTY
jgi:hypothetical protein